MEQVQIVPILIAGEYVIDSVAAQCVATPVQSGSDSVIEYHVRWCKAVMTRQQRTVVSVTTRWARKCEHETQWLCRNRVV